MKVNSSLALAAAAVLAAALLATREPAAGQPPNPQPPVSRIALVNFEQVVLASNEGQAVTANMQKKFGPNKDLKAETADIETMKKKLNSTISEQARTKLLAEINEKENKLNSDAQQVETAYTNEWREALSFVAQKVAVSMKNYAQESGYTLLLDGSPQASDVLWAQQSTDISQAFLTFYNTQSSVAPPSHAAAPLPVHPHIPFPRN
jgi:Skp family chaperone for outer membrane proteins